MNSEKKKKYYSFKQRQYIERITPEIEVTDRKKMRERKTILIQLCPTRISKRPWWKDSKFLYSLEKGRDYCGIITIKDLEVNT